MQGAWRRAISDAWRKNTPELMGLWTGALPDFVTARRPKEPLVGVPVFSYHLVEHEAFEADLEFLRANQYRTVRSAEMVAFLQGRCELPPRSVMLTFDDGAKNFHDVAFPLLSRYAAHATAFIAPGLHGDDDADKSFDARPMSWQEIRAIHAAGIVEFQSHTLESRFVPDWPMPVPLAGCAPALEASRRGLPQAFDQDLERSRGMLESQLGGATVDQLAFPMYVGTDAAVDAARALGFRACYWGLVPGRPLNRRGDSPFHISRASDEFVRRLPGSGRISVEGLIRARLHRAQTARQWRRRFA